MRTIGMGIDAVEVARVRRMIEEHGSRFLDRCFTAQEREYSVGQPRRAAEHLAARFAAKEAAFKAMGTGWSGGMAWTDVEVVRSESGAPGLYLCGEAARIAAGLGIDTWLLSLTHTDSLAIASAIGLSTR
jgi:holo-[acyl-carrier protein] synthase